MEYRQLNVVAIEAAFRALATALGCRTVVGVFLGTQQLAERLGSKPFGPADEAILATLPPSALTALGMAPDDFVRFVANVYELG